MKKDLIKKLQKNPKSKFLLNALKSCKEEIGNLVKESRKNNTKASTRVEVHRRIEVEVEASSYIANSKNKNYEKSE